MKTFRLIGLALMAVIISLGVSACSDDDDDVSTVYYNMYVDALTGGLEAPEKARLLEETYMSALGVTSTSFSLEGSISECDKKVKVGCEKAVNALAGETFPSEMKFVVNNQSTQKEVHSHVFK